MGEEEEEEEGAFDLTQSLLEYLEEEEGVVHCPNESCRFVFMKEPNPEIASGVTV